MVYTCISGIYLTLIMAMTAMSILICVMVLNLHHRDPNAPLPKWLRQMTFDVMAPLVFMTSQTKDRDTALYQLCELKKEFPGLASASASITPGSANGNGNNDSGVEMTADTQSCIEDLERTQRAQRRLSIRQRLSEQSTEESCCRVWTEVLKHVRVITAKLHENEEQDILKAEWKIAAKILDRFFLGLFVLLVIVSSIVMLYIFPLLGRHF